MNNVIEITTAKSSQDAERIALTAREIWTEHFTTIIGLHQVEYMLDKFQSADKIYEAITENGYTYYMANSSANKIVGYCAIKHDQKEKGIFLSKLYVEKNFRGRGISKQFLNLIIDKEKKEGYDYIWLTVNKNNLNTIAAYKKMGFVIVEDLVTDIGNGYVMDDYKMKLNISI